MSSKLDYLRSSEDGYISQLEQLQRLLEPRQTGPSLSSCDPLSQVLQQSKVLSGTCRTLVQRHAVLAQQWRGSRENAEAVLTSWLEDLELERCYSSLFNGSETLIFGLKAPLRQFSPTSEFTQLLLVAAKRLQQIALLCSPQNTRALILVKSFEDHFRAQWNKTDRSSFKYDQVRALVTGTHSLVSPPLIDAAQSTKRDYFTLDLPKMGYQNLLVELFQLSNGELGVFEVNSGLVTPASMEQISRLVLVSRNFKSVELGRSLLFPTLRKNDLQIISTGRGKVELKTKAGNGVLLSLTALESTQWEGNWQIYLESMFSKASLPSERQTFTSASLVKSTHPLQSFKLKHDKLTTLRPENIAGLGVSLTRCADLNTGAERRHDTLLHKSKPLDTFPTSPASSLHPLEDLEDLGCESLLRLNEDISLEGSPFSQCEPRFSEENFKRVNSESSVSRNEISIGELAEDCESILSSTGEEKEEEPFDLSSEFHRPQLTKRKSSSLLSLFSSNRSKTSLKNTKGLTLDLPSGNSTSSLLKLPRPEPSNIKPHATAKRDEFCTLPAGIDIQEGFRICDHEVKVSYWHEDCWKAISKNSLCFKLHETADGKVLCLLTSFGDAQRTKLCAAVTPDWKVTRPAAQDLQLRVPSSSFICSVLPAGPSVISLRCPQIETLINTLHHCIRQNLPSKIRASNTSGTLSTTSSTFSGLDKSVSRSDTASTGLSSIAHDTFSRYKMQTASLLLLSNVKIRLHQRNDKAEWEIQDKGLLDLYSQEIQGHVLAMKFDVIMGQSRKQEFVSKICDIRRIGRTGISLVHGNNDYLVEFKNQIVANEVFKLISCLM
ncbi:LAME_0G03818g1_1 [Lachancea meyersii CBS 8951]|uniref:LAME_0G03818g1_1 n=1 Tax=Lachancea meyersii CBS 8951 TaxID=1266667 RepID=A0A1G4K6Q0_9SACH|nr:LAME_0G03818g1_1 [Lachancea meyersii CBS 8951]